LSVPRSTFQRGVPSTSKAASVPEAKSATTVFPSVTGVGFDWLDFTWRAARGSPAYASRSHSFLPSLASKQSSRHEIGGLSAARSMPPLSPSTSLGSSAGTAVVTNTRSPHTIGLEWPTPGTSAFQRTLRPAVTSQSPGRF
jgi:hypothetical protein